MTAPHDSGAAFLSFAKLEQVLADLGALGQAMFRAIEEGDDERLLAAMQVSRRLRARLKESAVEAGSPGSAEAVERLRQLLAAAQTTEKIADRWMTRPLPPDRDLLAVPGGELFLADAILPPVWDFERDLVVLVGPDMAPLAAGLRRLGQERIFWYASGGDPDDGSVAMRLEGRHELAAALRGFGVETPQRLSVRALDPEHAETCAEVAEQFKTAISDGRIQRNTIALFNRNWLEQGLSNLPALCQWPTVAALDGAMAGKPLVVICPGPSLARNIHLLAELRGKAVLLAVSHAMTALSRAGVTPDFVLAVDPQDLRYHYAASRLDEVAAVVNAATVQPGLFELGAPGYLSLSANGTLDDWLYDLVGESAFVGGGGSVATTAFSLALRWRCNPIAVVGLDLSFPGGQYYIDSSCDGGTRAVVSDDGRTVSLEGWSQDFHRMKGSSRAQPAAERVLELPGWDGQPVPTSFMFGLFHRWFEERVRREDGATELFNCTEGGARIAGMNHVTLADFARRIDGSEVDARAAMARAVAEVQPAERRQATSLRLAELAGALRHCRARARRCSQLVERHAGAEADVAALTRAEADLVRALASVQLISMMAQEEIGHAMLSARDVATVAEAMGKSARIFSLVAQAVEWLEPRVVEARRALDA